MEMKKTLTLIAALAALALSSCKKEEKMKVAVSDVTFSVASPDTKAVKSNWGKGDEIMIFFWKKTDVGQQAKIRYNGSAWQLVQKLKNLSYAQGTKVSRYYAIHYPGEIIYNGENSNPRKIMNYRAGVVLCDDGSKFFNVSSEGVIELGTISLTKMGERSFQVVVPGISAKDNYTLSVTCDGQVYSAEDNYNGSSKSYGQRYLPYPNGAVLTFGGGFGNTYGVNNADGTEFYFWLNSNPSDAATSAYKYVFALSDGKQLYYHTKPIGYSNTIGDKSAIKLPEFDGKTTQTNWKTTLE